MVLFCSDGSDVFRTRGSFAECQSEQAENGCAEGPYLRTRKSSALQEKHPIKRRKLKRALNMHKEAAQRAHSKDASKTMLVSCRPPKGRWIRNPLIKRTNRLANRPGDFLLVDAQRMHTTEWRISLIFRKFRELLHFRFRSSAWRPSLQFTVCALHWKAFRAF